MSESFQKAVKDPDLIKAWACGIVAAALLSYVARVTGPGTIHAMLALVAVGAIIGAYLFVARSKSDVEWKGATIVGGGAVSVLCLWFLSSLY